MVGRETKVVFVTCSLSLSGLREDRDDFLFSFSSSIRYILTRF